MTEKETQKPTPTGYYGQWTAVYPSGEILVRIEQYAAVLIATKETNIGDFVPAGCPTWRFNLCTLECQGFISDPDGTNLRLVPARLVVLNQDKIKVTWLNLNNHPSVIFTRFSI